MKISQGLSAWLASLEKRFPSIIWYYFIYFLRIFIRNKFAMIIHERACTKIMYSLTRMSETKGDKTMLKLGPVWHRQANQIIHPTRKKFEAEAMSLCWGFPCLLKEIRWRILFSMFILRDLFARRQRKRLPNWLTLKERLQNVSRRLKFVQRRRDSIIKLLYGEIKLRS